MKSERHHREDICRVGKMLHERGYVAATDGNLSVRLDSDTVLCSPTMMCKGMMECEDLVVVDMSGRRVSGVRKVSSEIAMHLLIYKLRADVHGIVHAHPPTATGYAAAGLPLNQALISEIVISLGCVPLARYATPGTAELTQALEPLVPNHDAILMANHGVVTYGTDLLQAYMKMETVEHFGCIALVTHLLGRQQLLSGEDVRKLVGAREKYGISTPAEQGTGCPVTADVHSQSTARSGTESDGPERFSVTREELMSIVKDAVRNTKRRW
jgi:L-fuculose-phosphate aldolase